MLVCRNCGTENSDPGGDPRIYRCGQCGKPALERRPKPENAAVLLALIGAAIGGAAAGAPGAVLGGILGAAIGGSSKGGAAK